MITRKPIGEQPFTVFSNALLNDNLSAEALGVLVFLLSKPGDWKIMPGSLGKHFGCGRDKIYRIMGELIETGYAAREPDRDSSGVIRGWNYTVSNDKSPLPEKPEVDDSQPLPEKATSGESAPQKKDKTTKEGDSTSAKRSVQPYSEDFEEIWKLAADLGAPRTRDTSKKKAFDHWRMLNDENRARVRVAIPIFAETMRREGRAPDKIKHFQFFMSERVWETVSASAGTQQAAGAISVPWHETATRQHWERVLQFYESQCNWRASWGPAPGRAGCCMPQDLIDKLPYHLHPDRDRPKPGEAKS